MKTILCYGDSNTWGWNPATRGRFSRDERWPGVLRRELGDDYEVIEEGLNGRTTVWDHPVYKFRCGEDYLVPCLESHVPLDMVAILLGANDLEPRFGASASDIAGGVGVLVGIAQRYAPIVLLMAPPPLGALNFDFAEIFAGAEATSRRLAAHYKRVAELFGCAFLDTSDVVVASEVDGVHLDVGEHEKLGRAVAVMAKTLLTEGRHSSA